MRFQAYIPPGITEILPEILQLAADGKLTIRVQTIPIQEIDKIWNMTIEDGKRLVALI